MAALRLATDDAYLHLDRTAAAVRSLVGDALTAVGVPHLVQAAGNLFGVFFTDPAPDEVVDLAGAQRQAMHRFRAFFHAMLAYGVSLPPSAYEGWFVTTAHDERAVDRIATALPHAAQAAAQAEPGPLR